MSSWEALKKVMETSAPKKRKRGGVDLSGAVKSALELKRESQAAAIAVKPAAEEESSDYVPKSVKDRYLALDCEMVGIGPNGKRSALARCCLVNFDGETVYDNHVRPQAFVTDFRTKYSGIRQRDLRHGKAILFSECQSDVAALIKDKVLVGHALKNDMDVLMLSHSRSRIRDTATYRPYMRPHPKKKGKFRPRALRDLTKQHLGLTIQTGEHDPSEDARSAMMLYRRCRKEWELSLTAAKKSAKGKLAPASEVTEEQPNEESIDEDDVSNAGDDDV
jgi:RNA exonuclease 4